jgi:hypothetical protein
MTCLSKNSGIKRLIAFLLFFVFVINSASLGAPTSGGKSKKDVVSIFKNFLSEPARKKYHEQLGYQDEGGLFFASEIEDAVKCGKQAVPYLIDLRNDDDYVMRMVASFTLKRITGKEFCFCQRQVEYQHESLSDRKKCVANWKQWWLKSQRKPKLNRN